MVAGGRGRAAALPARSLGLASLFGRRGTNQRNQLCPAAPEESRLRASRAPPLQVAARRFVQLGMKKPIGCEAKDGLMAAMAVGPARKDRQGSTQGDEPPFGQIKEARGFRLLKLHAYGPGIGLKSQQPIFSS